MATLNLGRLKPVFRGAWNSSTAYNIDDIVVRSDESYISIQAGSNQDPASASAYWTKMAAKGTDVGATLANKEIAFKTNAGALDGIPIGTAGQFLKVNSGATGYEYGAVSSDFVKLAETTVTSGVASVAFEHGTGDVDFTGNTYKYHQVKFKDVHMTGDNERVYLYMRDSSSGSYLTSSGNYKECRMYVAGNSHGYLHGNEASARLFNGGTDSARVAYSTMNGEVNLFNMNDADNYSLIQHQTSLMFQDSVDQAMASVGSHFVLNTNVHDGIKFQGGSNIARGVFTLYGIK